MYWFRFGNGVCQGGILSPCLFNLYAEFSSVQISCSVMSDSLRPHELQHTKLLCSLLSRRVCSNSCPWSQWCCLTISSSATLFTFCLQSFQASRYFPVNWLFTSDGQNIGASTSPSVLPMNIQGWFPLGWTGWISLQSKGLSRVFSSTTVQKPQFFSARLSYSPTLTSLHNYWKSHSFDYTDICHQSDISAF